MMNENTYLVLPHSDAYCHPTRDTLIHPQKFTMYGQVQAQGGKQVITTQYLYPQTITGLEMKPYM